MLQTEIIDRFKKRFEEERHALLFPDNVVREEVQAANNEGPVDETDHAQVETEQSIRMQLRNREQLYLKKIEEALERISAGIYGECTICGGEISLKRLEARPTATMCIECKKEEEKKEKNSSANFTHKSLGDVFSMAE